jgi:hypothetical protein
MPPVFTRIPARLSSCTGAHWWWWCWVHWVCWCGYSVAVLGACMQHRCCGRIADGAVVNMCCGQHVLWSTCVVVNMCCGQHVLWSTCAVISTKAAHGSKNHIWSALPHLKERGSAHRMAGVVAHVCKRVDAPHALGPRAAGVLCGKGTAPPGHLPHEPPERTRVVPMAVSCRAAVVVGC